jgi:alginate O-acetyltransferase complex protein AlgI
VTFIQSEFLILLAVVLALYWGVPRRRLQNLVLLVASVVFYGWVHPWFLILLFGSATLDYFCARAMRDRPAHRKWFLTLSMVGNLGLLGWFKYFDFFVQNVIDALTVAGVTTDMTTLGIFLPVGISFYTFQTMSYSIDVYRGECEPRDDYLDYIVYVSFFPQLVAGPVERAQRLLVQVEQPRLLTGAMFAGGLDLALWGAFKKVVVADTIAPYVDKAFQLQEPGAALIAAASVGFAIQILADFSGYTDIARGVARMLGFELVENFKNPYLAVDPSDFWRRWHVSFSTWIRDYVYIPFGGSRGGFSMITRNTYIAMLLSGLWHGAAWTFVLWGAFHATLLTGYRLVKPRIPQSVRSAPWARPAAVVLMFGFTCAGWLIFRQTHLDRLVGYFAPSSFQLTGDQWIATATLLSVCALTALPLVVALLVDKLVVPRLRDSAAWLPARTTTWAVLAVWVFAFYRDASNDFIYFQF